MRKKINANFALMTMIAVVLTVVFSACVYYDMFQDEVILSLKTCANVLKNTGLYDLDEEIRQAAAEDGLRITLVEADGTVDFDSNADAGRMENHNDRPEVQEALQEGEGSDVRRSETLGRDTYYYALRLDSGQVLRVAKEAGNVFGFLISMVPILLLMGVLLLLVCMVLAHFLTRSIITPVEEMARHMDDESYEVAYREMEPFVDTIRSQHRAILQSSLMRQEFTANVSHELKTPLTAISGYSELIESGMATETDVRRFAGEIHKSSRRLLTLINDILRLSELDVAEGELPTEKVDLYDLTLKCVDMQQMSAEKHEVSLIFSGEPCLLRANREMVEEIIYNLCSNAIRYNVPKGRVVVSVAKENDQAVLTVEDTGIGIPQEDQKRIFERFYRVDKGRSKSTGGTGLGLAIVKHAAAKHEAEIGLWSQPGVGTRIRVVFPEKANWTD